MAHRDDRNPEKSPSEDDSAAGDRDSGPDASGTGRPELVVGLGASAGGLKPLADFLDELDDDLGAAYVIVQHLDPDRASTAPELLQRHTVLPVRKARDGEPLRPDHVYVNPPNTRIGVRDGALELQSPLEDRGHPTIVDHLFRSLADDQRNRSVAVVFSGTGSDGTLGVTHVREAGGLTMAQDPETAQFADMPESAIGTGDVDVVLSPPELASYLASYARRRAGYTGPDERQIETGQLLGEITRILQEQTDVDFSLYKESTLLRRIERRYLMSDVRDLRQYLELLEDEPQEAERLHADLLIGVTSFFRNREAFEALEEKAIGKLVERASSEEEIRVWVPACGTGQEAYSIAMLLSETVADAGHEASVKIFATDIDEQALSAARQGRYPRGIEDEIPGDLLRRYFDEDATGYRVSSDLRNMILFSKQNVLADPPFSDIDLISCRNLAIYLRTEVQEDLFRIFHFALRENGFLFLGESENVGGRTDLFQTVDQGARIFRRRSVETRMPLPMSLGSPSMEVSTSARFGASRVPKGEVRRGQFERRLERKLLDQLAPTSVVIDENDEVLYFHGKTGRFLEHPAGAPSHDIIEMVRPELRRELRTAIRHMKQTGEAVSREQVMVRTDGDQEAISLLVRPMSLDEETDLYLVVFRDSTAPDVAIDGAKEIDLDEASPDVVAEMEAELRDTRERLQSTIEELESSNEELRSMNEELQTANEELQTSREEARAANEELQTVNEELNSKIVELKRTHSDLENLLRSTQIATVFVDRQMRIRRFTPAATSIFRLQERDRGRSLADITSRLELPEGLDLIDQMEDVLQTLRPVEREVRVPDENKWFSMRVMPYRTVDDRIEGIVLTFTDVTKLKKLQLARSKLIAVMEGMPDAIVGRDRDGIIMSWNEGARRMFGYTEEEALGRNIDMLVPEDFRDELERHHRQAAEGSWTEPVETRRVRKDGEQIEVSVNFSCVKDEAGNVVEIAGIVRDITERIEAMKEIERANERQTEFMAMLSHELRNPLAPMRHAIDLLTGREEDPSVRSRAREILDRQIGYLSRLVDDLTEVARISAGTPSLERAPVDLVEIVRNVIRDYGTLADDFGAELDADLPEATVPVNGDEVRLSQVLGNLLDNAFTHTPAGGNVDVRLFTEAGTAVVTVEDEGPGLTEDQLEEVFEPFHQARETGTQAGDGLGLGLTVARRLVELHDGTLTAESGETGSVFRLRLPLESEDRGAPAPSEGEGSSPPGDAEVVGEQDGALARRVLIVEDYEDAAETMAMTLRSFGCDVEIVHDAAAGLSVAGEYRPDVVLCDIGLPGDRDGYDLARAIRSEPDLSDVRLVAITGFGSDLDRERADEAGFDGHLTKPVGSEELRTAVRRPG